MADRRGPDERGIDDAVRKWASDRTGRSVTPSDERRLLERVRRSETNRTVRRWVAAGATTVAVALAIAWLWPTESSTPNARPVAESPISSPPSSPARVLSPPTRGERIVVDVSAKWRQPTVALRLGKVRLTASNARVALTRTSSSTVELTVLAGRIQFLGSRVSLGAGQSARIDGTRVQSMASDVANDPPSANKASPGRPPRRRPTRRSEPTPTQGGPPASPDAGESSPRITPPKVVESAPEPPSSKEPSVADEVGAVQRAFIRGADVEGRIEALQRRAPDDVRVWMLTARIRSRQLRHREAAAIFAVAARHATPRRRISLLFERATELYKASELSEAAQQWEAVMDSVRIDHPFWSSVRLRLADTWPRLGRTDDARRVLREILARKPGSFAAEEAQAMLDQL